MEGLRAMAGSLKKKGGELYLVILVVFPWSLFFVRVFLGCFLSVFLGCFLKMVFEAEVC